MFIYDLQQLGEFLRKHREKMGLTQGEVAEKIGYSSPQFISNIERGVSVTPLHTLAALIKMYKCNQNEVIHLLMKSQREILRDRLGSPKAKKSRKK